MRIVGRLCVLAFKLILIVFIYGSPILGVWLGSSLAAYLNGPIWISFAVGVLLFPVLPFLWEVHASKRRKRKRHPTPRTLTFGDRLTLRTFAINAVVILALLAIYPQTTFLALSTRGDWVLDSKWLQERVSTDQLNTVRQRLFQMAGGLEWLYDVAHRNPYKEYVDDATAQKIIPTPFSEEKPELWPWQTADLHSAVARMPENVEQSVKSVAQYLAQRERDPFLRVKALHDYVADRIAYDAKALREGRYPPQDAGAVLNTRKAVCAGYANLLAALGQYIDEEIIVVTGDSRNQSGAISGNGHAWNAARIEGNWYLLDATWNSGYVDDSGFHKQYRTDYLFPPPDIMAITHYPENSGWQLLEQPLTRGEFLRQPLMRPAFFAEGMELLEPTRSQVDVWSVATVDIKNPRERWLMATFSPKGAAEFQECDVDLGETSSIYCPLPIPGTYEVNLFSSGQQYGTYQFVGRLEFNKRG